MGEGTSSTALTEEELEQCRQQGRDNLAQIIEQERPKHHRKDRQRKQPAAQIEAEDRRSKEHAAEVEERRKQQAAEREKGNARRESEIVPQEQASYRHEEEANRREQEGIRHRAEQTRSKKLEADTSIGVSQSTYSTALPSEELRPYHAENRENVKARNREEERGALATAKSATANQQQHSPLQKMSKKESRKLVAQEYLEKHSQPFSVATASPSKKRKRDEPAWKLGDNLWESRLSIQYKVNPADKWQSLKRYRKFAIGSESIARGQCILVRCDSNEDGNEGEEARFDVAQQWIAKVLEVRALDPKHVFILVAWLNRPEDLKHGRRDYHGKNELIPTNQMDVINALAVNGAVDVIRWDDSDQNAMVMSEDRFFWRNTFDATTSTLSKLPMICVDNKPQNPDEIIVQCSNEECKMWLHVKCIIERALKSAARAKKEGVSTTPKTRSHPKNTNVDPSSLAVARSTKGDFIGEVFLKGYSNGVNKDITATDNELVITDTDGARYAEDVCCLQCGKTID